MRILGYVDFYGYKQKFDGLVEQEFVNENEKELLTRANKKESKNPSMVPVFISERVLLRRVPITDTFFTRQTRDVVEPIGRTPHFIRGGVDTKHPITEQMYSVHIEELFNDLVLAYTNTPVPPIGTAERKEFFKNQWKNITYPFYNDYTLPDGKIIPGIKSIFLDSAAA